jgi:hypothetical protein
VADTVSATWGSARQYMNNHPGATRSSTRRSTSRVAGGVGRSLVLHRQPCEYYDLKGILAPIGDKQRQCNVTVLPPQLLRPTTRSMAG